MFKTFCDNCGRGCEAKGSVTRRFENLTRGQDAKQLGFEVVLLADGQNTPELHVCDGCLFNMIWELAAKRPDSPLGAKRNALKAKEATHATQTMALEAQGKALDAREEALAAREAEFQRLLVAREVTAEEMKKLKVAVEKDRERKRLSLLEAQKKQAAIDAEDRARRH